MLSSCKFCNSKDIAKVLGICRNCIERFPEESKKYIRRAHSIRKRYNLPIFPPRKGVECNICGNSCKISPGEVGFCGLSKNVDGKLVREVGNERIGLAFFYKDWHPTNCVPSRWCAGGSGAGYPKYAKRKGTEIGYANASIFLGTCSFHCLFCQNTDWHNIIKEKKPVIEANSLASCILEDKDFTCVCWFGGSPEPQAPFAWNVSRMLRKEARKEGRILRICLEANGNFSWYWLKKIAKISFESGGGIKFDLKTPRSSNLNLALCATSNEIVYKNFEKLVKFHERRPEVPFLRASTLLVPHYITLEDVKEIVKFLASLDKTIPYSLLAFYPSYLMKDLPLTTRNLAEKCYSLAKKFGLKKVNIGNLHLLA